MICTQYLDVFADAITNYMTAVVVALTLGQIGPSTPEVPNFLTQIYQVAIYTLWNDLTNCYRQAESLSCQTFGMIAGDAH